MRGQDGYVSYETVLSEWSIISQVPFVLTVATTGRSRRVDTLWGTVDFTHTERPLRGLYRYTQDRPESPLRYALPNQAFIDLQEANRCLDLVDMDGCADVMAELRQVVPALRHVA